MKKHNRVFAILLALAMIITYMSGAAFALDDPTTVAPSSMEPERIVPDVNIDDDLLQEYIDEKVAEEIRQSSGKAFSKRTKTKLSGPELNAYNALVPLISEVASGNSPSAEFEIPVEAVYGEEKANARYTAQDLGVDSLIDGNRISKEAVDSFYDEYSFDFSTVLYSLLADLPYELYWFDKTDGVSYDCNWSVSYESDSRGEYLCIGESEPTYCLGFSVSGDYSANAYFDEEGYFHRGDLGTTNVNQALTGAAADAAGNIADTINDNKNKNDYDKLVSYKNTIIGLSDYNEDALDPNYPYGDPWQLIFVFDKDPFTKVVCEGYAKAFQYLCDNTLFDHSAIECWTVSGEMNGGTGAGNHMWNILHMDDGNNYIADITNCGENSMGYDENDPDESRLFLNGYNSKIGENKYKYSCVFGSISYEYNDRMLAIYSRDELAMSKDDYIQILSDINELNLTLGTPICGTEVNTEGPWPELAVKSDRVTKTDAFWEKDGEAFAGKMLGGETYTANIVAEIPSDKREEFSYKDDITVKVNGVAVSPSRISRIDEATVAFSADIKAAHELTQHPATKPSTTKSGNKAYWSCDGCGKFFGDAAGTTEIEENSWVIPKLISISKASVTGVANVVFTGKAIIQKPVVKLSGKTLVPGKDYKLTYKNNKNVGTATVIVTGTGVYGGAVSKSFKINPNGTTIKTLTASKNGFTAKWKKQTVQTTGYQIQCALNKKFTSGKKQVTVTKNRTVSKKISKMKARKKYFVRIRTYKKVGSKKYYSAWSPVVKVTTK